MGINQKQRTLEALNCVPQGALAFQDLPVRVYCSFKFINVLYVEKVGSGINRIKNSMKEAGLPEPRFEYNYSFLIILNDKTEGVWENDSEKVEKTVEKITELIINNPKITQKELSEQTGLTRRGVEWNIEQLKQKGIIKRIGSDREGHWEVLSRKVKNEK